MEHVVLPGRDLAGVDGDRSPWIDDDDPRLLVAAVISPRVGLAIERRGGRDVLAMSAVALGLGQLGLAIAPNRSLHIAAWLVVGLGMGAGLYDAAFATLGRLYGREARASITALTLFGGLASTVCWPLSTLLVSSFGWRGACLTYAAVQFGFVLPLYLLALPRTLGESPGSENDRPIKTASASARIPVSDVASGFDIDPRSRPVGHTVGASVNNLAGRRSYRCCGSCSRGARRPLPGGGANDRGGRCAIPSSDMDKGGVG